MRLMGGVSRLAVEKNSLRAVFNKKTFHWRNRAVQWQHSSFVSKFSPPSPVQSHFCWQLHGNDVQLTSKATGRGRPSAKLHGCSRHNGKQTKQHKVCPWMKNRSLKIVSELFIACITCNTVTLKRLSSHNRFLK